MFKKLGFAIYDLYNFFFSLKVNPLRHIPNAFTQFILMFYLSVMWTVVFTLWAGYTIYFGIGSVGGKSPFVVFDDADLDSAVEGVVDAIWFNQGQVC